MRRGKWGETRNSVPYLVCTYRTEGHLHSEENGRNTEEEVHTQVGTNCLYPVYCIGRRLSNLDIR